MIRPDDALRHPVFRQSDELVDRLCEISPIQATFLGVPGHDHRWDDLSPEGYEAKAELWRTTRRALAEHPAPDGDDAALAVRVLADAAAEQLEAHDHGDHHHDLNNIASTFQSLRMVFDVMDPGTPAGCADVAMRLESIDQAYAGYEATLREGLARGRIVARRQVDTALEQAAVLAGDGSSFEGFKAAAAQSDAVDAAARARLDRAVTHARHAVETFARFLRDEYLPKAVAHDAVGEERYLRAAARHLGMKLDAREAYAWGWEEIRRIESEMTRLAKELAPGQPMPEVIVRLKQDPDLCARSADEFLALMLARQQQALEQLDGRHFDVPAPARHVDVKRSPPGNALGAYYIPPSEDFSRAGCVWYALVNPDRIPLFGEISTAYHEGFPGHHLQLAVQVFRADRLSRYQRLIAGNTGHAEGWALYAETLMHELGYLERPEYVIGMLTEQLLRAYRVVIDIGLHLELPIPSDAPFERGQPWTFERAVAAMHTRGFQSQKYAESEVTRYMGWPGQAIAYKIGQRVMLDLRETVRRARGPAFSLKAFHAELLDAGSVGLDLLKDWLGGGKRR